MWDPPAWHVTGVLVQVTAKHSHCSVWLIARPSSGTSLYLLDSDLSIFNYRAFVFGCARGNSSSMLSTLTYHFLPSMTQPQHHQSTTVSWRSVSHPIVLPLPLHSHLPSCSFSLPSSLLPSLSNSFPPSQVFSAFTKCYMLVIILVFRPLG